MLIEKVNSPADIKGFTAMERKQLANEIRELIINKASEKGAHVGPNLGMIEITIAMHHVFNSPKDKFVFDVSHQCYTHKILTGRKDAYLLPEHYNDVSGFTNPKESEHDLFNVGHTSTSISLAAGLAKGRDLLGENHNVVAVIGDGSLSGGQAYEGLHFCGELNTNCIIIVNDNQMSIAENHGSIYKHLKELRDTKGEAQNNIFKSLGFKYIYSEDGHDTEKLIELLNDIKDTQDPIVLHTSTKKGNGCEFAMKAKEDWHFRPPFHKKDGSFRNVFTNKNYDDMVCDYLLDKMNKDKGVVAVVAAVPWTIGFTDNKRELAGKQFVDVGIAEAHGVTMSAAIAKAGGKPVFATFSTFYQRAFDQIAQELCITKLPVTMLVRNASIWGMPDITHLGFFDIPMMANIPNLVYLAPTNEQEYFAMLDWSIEQNEHPVAIRIPKNGVHQAKGAVDKDYSTLNKYKVCEQGKTIAVVALGDFFQLGEDVVKAIKDKLDIDATLINPRYITGIDSEVLDDLKKDHELVITLEDGILSGGFGANISSYFAPSNVKVLNYGFKKEFIDRYNASEIMYNNRLSPDLIIEDIKKCYKHSVK